MSPNNYTYDDYGLEQLFMQRACDVGFSMPLRHLHSQYEFLFILEGDVSVECNASTFTVTTPSLVVHKPFSLHRAAAKEGVLYRRVVLNLSEELLFHVKDLIPHFSLLASAGCTVIPLNGELLTSMEAQLDGIYTDYTENKQERLLLKFALLLLDVTDHAMLHGPAAPDSADYISEVIKYVNAHFADDIKIDELADHFFVSRSKLISDFKRSIGVPIKKYTMFVRICNAQTYLNEGKSITETALLCGFYDNSHFISSFRQLTGSTPKEYLRKVNNG